MNAIEAASKRASRLYVGEHYRAAYVKGAAARLHGRPVEACPYRRGRGGWSPAWRAAWLRGWESVGPRRSVDDD